jgi:hypothetical protein
VGVPIKIPVRKRKKPQQPSKSTSAIPQAQLASPDVLSLVFSETNLHIALRRIAKRDKDNVVSHPLQSLVLTEFRKQIVEYLSRSVPLGTWSPSGAYLLLTSKRSGAYRELVFPTLIDGIVGRCLIDAIEPQITADDDGKTFSGRSHFSNRREPGDYDDWFQVWQDYSAAIEAAAQRDGYTYVFDTDVNDFFPSIDRSRAKALIAARTGAHASLLELLFYCLEAWLPRFGYAPMTGLPVEQNDVSRVVAHGYLKGVDAVFKARNDCTYLRYCDDTVVFAQSEEAAWQLRRLHHLQLRQLGLSPSAAKSAVMSVEDFQALRHRDMNIRLDAAKKDNKTDELEFAIAEWWSHERAETVAWDKIARKIYSLARQMKSEMLRSYAVEDAKVPGVGGTAVRYLSSFDLQQQELIDLLALSNLASLDMSTAFDAASAILDARTDVKWSSLIVQTAYEMLHAKDTREGAGYLKGQWLLILHKYGLAKDREKIKSLGVNFVDDPMWRLLYLYVGLATSAIKLADAGSASALANSDIQLTLRLCGAALTGTLQNRDTVLKRLVTKVNGKTGILGRHLPLVRIIVESKHQRTSTAQWLKRLLGGTGLKAIGDPVVLQFLRHQHERLTM